MLQGTQGREAGTHRRGRERAGGALSQSRPTPARELPPKQEVQRRAAGPRPRGEEPWQEREDSACFTTQGLCTESRTSIG